jgi:asparagine synthase (glutamine-hydrolysing)
MFGDLDHARDRRVEALALSRRMRHRGPDATGVYAGARAILVHERLAIVDPAGPPQPLRSPSGDQILAVNGEIYNHRELRARLGDRYSFQTGSDCEAILALYQTGDDPAVWLEQLSGIFAFALYDARRDRHLIARDPIGVIPLYFGTDEQGNRYVASEVKALVGRCTTIEDFPPGCYLDSAIGRPVRYYNPGWRDFVPAPARPYDPSALRRSLEAAVERQLMADVPWGVLLSGGLDSSLVSAIAAARSATPLHSFSIGLQGSPDLAAARKVSEALGTRHHEIVYSIEEGIDALSDVIWHIETFDVTTIRASTPMYLMARRIRSMGIKMVLSGEGADEVFGGYLYFHKAPSPHALHEETVRKLMQLHKFDCLRANKSLAAWGVEGRVPFLDREFLDVAMALDPAVKMCTSGRIEKWALRTAFEDLLPGEILWRQKEQFSDGVGYGWIDSLKALAEREVSDTEIKRAASRFPQNTPLTKEAYFYRDIFERLFPSEHAVRCVPEGKSIACSTEAALAWDASFAQHVDPSGRAVRGVHHNSH